MKPDLSQIKNDSAELRISICALTQRSPDLQTCEAVCGLFNLGMCKTACRAERVLDRVEKTGGISLRPENK